MISLRMVILLGKTGKILEEPFWGKKMLVFSSNIQIVNGHHVKNINLEI